MDVEDLTKRVRRAKIWLWGTTVVSIVVGFYFGHDPEILSGYAYLLGLLVGLLLGVNSAIYGLTKVALNRANGNL